MNKPEVVDKSILNEDALHRQPSVMSNVNQIERYERAVPQNTNQENTKIFSPHHKPNDSNFKESLQAIQSEQKVKNQLIDLLASPKNNIKVAQIIDLTQN